MLNQIVATSPDFHVLAGDIAYADPSGTGKPVTHLGPFLTAACRSAEDLDALWTRADEGPQPPGLCRRLQLLGARMSPHRRVLPITTYGSGGHSWLRRSGSSRAPRAASAVSGRLAHCVAALERMRDDFGDAVLPLQIDVTDRAAAAIAAAVAHFGRLDVVVNNAGYGQYGFVEELSEDEIRAQMEPNFYGAVWVTQAALPYLRQQRSGHIVQVTSTGGLVTAADIAMYSASKFALEGLSEALAHEVKPFGVHVTIIEPGSYATDFGSACKRSDAMPDYAEVHAQAAETLAQIIASASDPATTVDPLLAVVDAEQPPLRLLLGPGTFTLVKSAHDERLEKWAPWNVSRSISAV